MSDETSTNSADYVLLTRLADEFAARYRAGERPSLQEYIDRHPELADEIRELFPAMVEIEQVKEDHQQDALQAAAPAAAAVRQLGDFRILREIGQGGMGIVYEAEQVSLGRHVALKVLPKNMLLDAQAKRRFEREAKCRRQAAPHQHRAGLRRRRARWIAVLRDAVHSRPGTRCRSGRAEPDHGRMVRPPGPPVKSGSVAAAPPRPKWHARS